MSGFGGTTYIITNKLNTTLYTGSTVELIDRIIEHRQKLYPNSFSSRYNLNKLVYYKHFSSIMEARDFEYYIKGKNRNWKIELISDFNPYWDDLFDKLD